MKRILIHAGILLAVFIAAVIGFSYLTNRENSDMTADIQSATLPAISFKNGETDINQLMGYVEEMDIPSMRDTITPISNNKVRMNVHNYGAKVLSYTYEVYTLDGKSVLLEETKKELEDEITLQFGEDEILTTERVLKVTLHLEEEKDVYFYTRVVDSKDMNAGLCIGFAYNFFESEMDKNASQDLKEYLETDSTEDNMNFHSVTIQSSLESISWGDLQPTVTSEVYCTIKEINTTYTSIQLEYQVTCSGEENELDLYNVKEFFRVRDGGSTMYLFDYARTMNQVFDGDKKVLSEKGIVLGIAPYDVKYMTDDDGTMVSFVQERALWSYNKEADELSMVFSFAGTGNDDRRDLYDQHEVSLISVEDSGSTTFAVSGYMNRGAHEGESGIAIYYFNSDKNAVEEQAFIPSVKSYSILQNDTERMVYYSSQNHLLYALINGTLYEINLEKDKREVLVRGMQEGQYVASNDGHIFAYQTEGTLDQADEVTVLNLASGKKYTVESKEDECIRPLGFVNDDFIYGTARTADIGTTVSGETVIPMYKLEISNAKKEILKSYELENTYILDVFVEGNFITLNRVVRNQSVYTGINADYITNNEEGNQSNISLEAYTTERKKTQMRLTYEDGIKDQRVKLLQPKQVLFKNTSSLELEEVNTDGKYYVYARGELKAVYRKAAYAVHKAVELSGVAVSSNQEYLWEKRGRETAYMNEEVGVFSLAEGESTLIACLNKIIQYEGGEIDVAKEFESGKSPMEILDEYIGGEGLDLTGCAVDDVLYTVGRGRPVIAVTGENQAILLIGYDNSTVTYLDPSNGSQRTVTTNELEEMVKPSGHAFIGYLRNSE